MPPRFFLNIFAGLVLIVGFLIPGRASAQEGEAFLDYCLDSSQDKNVCPEKICEMRCAEEDGPDCIKICLPRECPQISATDCPAEYCDVMTDCSDKKICNDKMVGGAPECGDLAYAGQDVACCEGLVRRCGVEFLDGGCDMEGEGSVYNIPICIPCGDGICGQFEDHCNCPEDCADIKEEEALDLEVSDPAFPSEVEFPSGNSDGTQPKVWELTEPEE